MGRHDRDHGRLLKARTGVRPSVKGTLTEASDGNRATRLIILGDVNVTSRKATPRDQAVVTHVLST